MKVQALQSALRSALKHARLETASFGHLGHGNTPVKFEDGRSVTEANVSDFIRERVRLHHASWIIPQIETALALIAASQPHPHAPVFPGAQTCGVCHKGPEHSLHKGF